MKTVLICIPTYSHVETETFKSIWDMNIPKNVKVDIQFVKGYVVSTARNKLADIAIEKNYDYTLWIDSDIIVPSHLLEHLYNIIDNGKADMATGYYVKKIEGKNVTEIYGSIDNQPNSIANILEEKLPKTAGVYPCKSSGFGCILIKTEVFKKIKEKYPNNLPFEYINIKNATISEDIFFLQRANELGFNLMVDTSCRCGHIGQKIF